MIGGEHNLALSPAAREKRGERNALLHVVGYLNGTTNADTTPTPW